MKLAVQCLKQEHFLGGWGWGRGDCVDNSEQNIKDKKKCEGLQDVEGIQF